MNPKISVVIPTYNRAHCIRQTIDSVLGQTFTDRELIIIDDGSRDETRKVLAPYGAALSYHFQENGGVCAAINAGLAMAKGRWIAIQGSDDEWHEDYLKEQMSHVSAYPDAIAHFTDAVTIREEDGRREPHFHGTRFDRMFRGNDHLHVARPFPLILGHSPWFVQSALLDRAALLEAGAFDPGLSIAEDFDVLARMALLGPFVFCRRELACIYRRKEQTVPLSSKVMTDEIATRETFAGVLRRLAAREGLTPDDRRALALTTNANLRGLANLFAMSGRTDESRKRHRMALANHFDGRSLAGYLLSFAPREVGAFLNKMIKAVHPGKQGA